MHKYPQNQSYVGSSGQTLTTNVSMTYGAGKLITKPMSYVAALHLYRINSGPKLTRSLRPLWLGQGRSFYGGYKWLRSINGSSKPQGPSHHGPIPMSSLCRHQDTRRLEGKAHHGTPAKIRILRATRPAPRGCDRWPFERVGGMVPVPSPMRRALHNHTQKGNPMTRHQIALNLRLGKGCCTVTFAWPPPAPKHCPTGCKFARLCSPLNLRMTEGTGGGGGGPSRGRPGFRFRGGGGGGR